MVEDKEDKDRMDCMEGRDKEGMDKVDKDCKGCMDYMVLPTTNMDQHILEDNIFGIYNFLAFYIFVHFILFYNWCKNIIFAATLDKNIIYILVYYIMSLTFKGINLYN